MGTTSTIVLTVVGGGVLVAAMFTAAVIYAMRRGYGFCGESKLGSFGVIPPKEPRRPRGQD